MADDFLLTVTYRGLETEYKARLFLQGYTFKICVTINDMEVYFERDEEGSFRVARMPDQDEMKLEKIDKDLLIKLKEKIEEMLS